MEKFDLEFEVRRLILEMNDPRHDGYVTSGIRDQLKRIRSIIDNALMSEEEFLETKEFY